MSSKDPSQSQNKSSAKQQVPKPMAENLDLVTEQPALSADLLQQARSDPGNLKPRQMLQLQKVIGNQAIQRLLDSRPEEPGTPADTPIGSVNGPIVQRRDLHQGAAVPDTAGQEAITGAMNPRAEVSTGGTVTVRTWGGRTGGGRPTPAQRQVRTQTFRALHNAIRGELNQNLSWLQDMAQNYATDRVSPADLEGAGNAAAGVVRNHVGSYIRNSVGGVARSRHGFRAGSNLLDAYDPADRATAGEPISAEAVVWWALMNTSTWLNTLVMNEPGTAATLVRP